MDDIKADGIRQPENDIIKNIFSEKTNWKALFNSFIMFGRDTKTSNPNLLQLVTSLDV